MSMIVLDDVLDYKVCGPTFKKYEFRAGGVAQAVKVPA
jgi:hypothetical protein